MTTVQIIFAICYVALLISYFFSETSGNFPRRAVNKIVMASAFLGYVIVEFIRLDYQFSVINIVMLIAFFLSWLGDVVLLWDFTKGGIAFMSGNLFFFVYLILLAYKNGLGFSQLWLAGLILLILVGTVTVLYLTKKVDFGKYGILMIIYLLTVTLHGSLGIVMAIQLKTVRMVLLGLGLALFMVSDYFLITNKFIHKRNWVLRCNSGTYFFGLMLAAMSLSF